METVRAGFVRGAAIAVVGLGLAGCVGMAQPLYHWGRYEDVLHAMYAAPGTADPATQIEKLTADMEQARAEGLKVPPGVHAHLGYLHYLQGDAGRAREALVLEKVLFPESATFVDRLLERLGP